MTSIRIGHGYDVHRLVEGRALDGRKLRRLDSFRERNEEFQKDYFVHNLWCSRCEAFRQNQSRLHARDELPNLHEKE